jgi:hypothetical protein
MLDYSKLQAKAGASTKDDCPLCGAACNHTPQQKQMFALDALKEASDWYESLKK